MDTQQQIPDRGSTSNNGNRIVMSVALVAVLAIAMLGYVLTQSKTTTPTNHSAASDTTQAATTTAEKTLPNTSASTPDTSLTNKDGNYSANGSYQTPGGQESIGVSLKLKDDTITAVNVSNDGITPDAKEYQTKFTRGIQDAVVGKKITGLKLSRVSGSSLTPKGFNEALAKIQLQAKS